MSLRFASNREKERGRSHRVKADDNNETRNERVGTKPKILVIDDDRQVCGFLAELLEIKGFEVLQAHDGPEGVHTAKEARPQLVLLDYMLPGMSGIQVLKEIRNFDPQIGVIMVIGFEIPELMNETFKAGAHDYITKPIDMVYFDGVVMELITDLLYRSTPMPGSGRPKTSP